MWVDKARGAANQPRKLGVENISDVSACWASIFPLGWKAKARVKGKDPLRAHRRYNLWHVRAIHVRGPPFPHNDDDDLGRRACHFSRPEGCHP